MVFFFYTLFLTISLSFLSVAIGYAFLSRLSFWSGARDNVYFRAGLSFFTGTGLGLFGWSLLTHLTGDARLSLYLILAIIIAWLIKERRTLAYFKTELPSDKKILLVILLFMSLGLLRAVIPIPQYFATESRLVPFAGFGDLNHSFRAGNISNYIIDHDYFPRFNQNSAQSIIAAAPIFLGSRGVQLSLIFWLSIFIAFFTLLIYGLTRRNFLDGKLALIPPAIVLLGNTVLSPAYSAITDIQSAILLIANYEGLFSIATLLISLIFLYEALIQKKFRNSWLWLFGLFGFIWNITGPQSTLLFIFSLILTFIFFQKDIRVADLAKILGSFLLAVVLGAIIQGGMLYPSRYTENPPIGGLMEIKSGQAPLIGLRFPQTGEFDPQTFKKIGFIYQQLTAPIVIPASNASITVATSSPAVSNPGLIARIKSDRLLFSLVKIAKSFQAVFFPLLGLSLFYLFKKKKIIENHSFNHFFWIHATALFLVGWAASTFFLMYGYSWELARFLHFGCFASMYVLGLALVFLINHFQIKKKAGQTLAVWFLIGFILFGPSAQYFIADILGNFILPYVPPDTMTAEISRQDMSTMKIPDRFNLLINLK